MDLRQFDLMVNPFPSHSLFVLSSVGRPRCENMTLTCNGRQLSAYPAAPAEKQHSWRLAKNGSIRRPASSKVWTNPKQSPTSATSHPHIRFAPTESGQHGRNQKNLLGVKTIRFLHHSTKHAAKHDTTSNILLCVFLFLLVCVHYHYHNEIGASLIGRKISPRYVSF